MCFLNRQVAFLVLLSFLAHFLPNPPTTWPAGQNSDLRSQFFLATTISPLPLERTRA